MNETQSYDLVVIGGGPAGYAAAIKAGQLGKKVACVEKERAGGTCLNWGCIPSKALLKSAELVMKMRRSEDFGVRCKDIEVDFPKMVKRSRAVADKMAGGIEYLFKKNKVDYIQGSAMLIGPHEVRVNGGERDEDVLHAEKILIATGCRARHLPGVEHDGRQIMTSREALVLEKQPKSVAIIGAGAIGAEFAYFLNALKTEVHLIEMLPQILPVEDGEVGTAVERSFKKQGIQCYAGTKVAEVKKRKGSVLLKLEKGKTSKQLEVESVLVAIGVEAHTEGLLGDKVKLEMERNYIKVDETYQTSMPDVYAAGDIIGPPWLAHVATFEALQAVAGMFQGRQAVKVKTFPGCTYCQPQVASVGLTEEKLKEQKVPYKVGKFPFTASGKAVASDLSEGFVKMLVGEEHGEILGAHIVGSDATELIAEYVLAIELEATAEEIHSTIHAHPTMSEAMMEAAAAVYGEAIHI